jgi:hypothetical protein
MNRKPRLWLKTTTLLLLLLATLRTGSAAAAPLLDVIEVPCALSAGLPLGQAIELTNKNPGHDLIRLEADCTYGLFFTYVYVNGHNGLPVITDALTIEGNGARLERMTNTHFRLMQTAVNASLTIKDLTLANGYVNDPNDAKPDGGAIYAVGDLTLENVTIVDNVAPGAGGGVAAIGGSLTITGSHFENNESLDDFGGGVYSFAETTFENVTFTNNRAGESGGGAFIEKKASVANSRFEGNEVASDDGGGLAVWADLNLVQTDFVNNKSYRSGGGGLYVAGGHADITLARFESNTAWEGGGLYAEETRVTLVQSIFLNNEANANGAGAYLDLKSSDPSEVIDNLWVGNHCSQDSATITIYHDSGTSRVDILHNTLADPEDDNDMAIAINDPGSSRVVNNIIANYATGLVSYDPGVTSGYNLYLISNPADTEIGPIEPFEGGHNLIALPGSQFVDAAGGDYRLKGTSPAIDRGFNLGIKVDLSGIARPQIDGYDLGAYEFVASGIAPTAVDDTYSTPQDTTLSVAIEGVLRNDIKAEGGSLKAEGRSAPANGSVTLNENGSFNYIPKPGFVGEDSFTYVAIDRGIRSNEATVRIRVGLQNQAAYTVFLPLIRK